jgi:hypothetical protein
MSLLLLSTTRYRPPRLGCWPKLALCRGVLLCHAGRVYVGGCLVIPLRDGDMVLGPMNIHYEDMEHRRYWLILWEPAHCFWAK